jgi:diguanylate cyclase (GGDEF)-like protein
MSAARTVTTTGELVPIADRLRYLQGFRLLLAAVVAACAIAGSQDLEVPLVAVAGVTTAYLVTTIVALLGWRMSRTGATRLFGMVLILDGVYLGWSSYVTGGAGSPIRYLMILHLIAVCLLASYRTGLKLAMWDTLLLLVVFYAQQAELLRPLGDDTGHGLGSPLVELVVFSSVFWLVALVTSSFSAVNERELRRRRYDLEALAVMARRLEEATGSSDAADTLVATVADTFSVERAMVLAARDGGALEVLASRGDIQVDGPLRPADESILRVAMGTSRTQLTASLHATRDAALARALPDGRNLVVVPLSAGKRALGVLVLEHPMRAGSRIERRVVSMLERLAAHAALALRNAWLLEEIQHLAATDALTGLANRATFQITLGQELARARRAGGDVSLVLLDIDHFKALNDTHGHLAGDEVLRGVSAALDECCRAFDTPARYGGEEFAVVLPQTDAEEALAVAERLREAIAGARVEPGVTVSVGVATFPLHGDDPDDLVKAADDALYASKRAGRDRVTSAA